MSPLARPIEEAEFAVVDTETVGASGPPVEIAVVVVSGAGELIEEWTTLVNPGEPVGWAATKVHGLREDHLARAPRFTEIVGDLDALLDQRILVGHNVRFDLDVLRGAYLREGFDREWSGLCTQRAGFRRSLEVECASCGYTPSGAWHQALTDARATAFLLGQMLQLGSQAKLETLSDVVARFADVSAGCHPFVAPTPAFEPCRRVLTRMQRAGAIEDGLTLVAGIVGAMPPTARSSDTLEYRQALGSALADRMITADEIRALVAAAANGGLTREHLASVHHEFFGEIAAGAAADRAVSAAEAADLACVAALLNIGNAEANRIVDEALAAALSKQAIRQVEGFAEGTRVVVTGAVPCTIGGVPVSRADLEELIEQRGLVMKKSVSARSTDLVVLCDPASGSRKAEQARALGKPIINITEFLQRLGVRVD